MIDKKEKNIEGDNYKRLLVINKKIVKSENYEKDRRKK